MDREAAKRLIRQTLEQPFNRDQFTLFIKNLLNHLEPAPFPRPRTGQLIFEDFRDRIASFDRVGKYTDKDGKKLDVLIVNLKRGSFIDRARATQRKFVAKYLKQSQGGQEKHAALVAFVSPNEEDWRFSFVKMEYKFDETGRVKEEFTPARRYSFLVGKNENSHTAQSQLLPILENTDQDPTIRSIEERFSIEKVTKEFFEQYRELYHKVKDALDTLVTKDKDIREDFKNKGVDTVDFSKKLLGQIVFLYFLQKKGWFGVKRKAAWGTGSKHFLRELFQAEHGQYKNFFNDILEPLFYEALADGERKEDYYSRFDCKIPFLNGGLFDPLNNYDWVNTDILLPNELFSNDGKTKQGDTGTGILDVLDRYNFTVKEDEPLEKEVAIDPEMLGKVFENLLEVKDRKSKGTYYTPREIVHYMCQESLINYLATELRGTVPREDIETLIKHGETALENDALVSERGEERGRYKYKLPESVRDNAQVIDEKLADIKVCDPAVGSGAFLVGMMSEIIRTRMVLSEFLDTDTERTPYDLKRHAIQNSLYGVDIDLGAVEIAKLRLWLSLIVDEEDYKHIKPLPNLDYKIMQGNSLLEEYESIKLIDERFFDKREEKVEIRERLEREQSQIQRDYIRLDADGQLTKVKKAEYDKRLREIEKQLKEIDKPRSNGQDNLGFFGKTEAQSKADKLLDLHERFFNAYHKSDKDRIHKQINELTWDLIETTLTQKGKEDKLEDVKIFQRTNTSPFFLWKLNFADVFREKRGFDVVIANPPYGADIDDTTEIYKRVYPNTTRAYKDIYKIFIELGLEFLTRKNGVLCYILPNTLLLQPRYKDARSFLLRHRLVTIVNLGEEVFEQVVVPTCVVLVMCGHQSDSTVHFSDLSTNSKFNGDMNTLTFADAPQASYESTPGHILFGTVRQLKPNEVLLDHILEMKDCGIKYQRTKIGLSKKGGSDLAKRIFYEGSKKHPSDKPFLTGRDLHRDGWYLDKTPRRYLRHDYKELLKTNEVVYFNEQFFMQPEKLVWRQTSPHFTGAYLNKQMWFANTLQGGVLKKEYVERIDLKFLLALLNSTYLRHLYTCIVREYGRVFPQVKLTKLRYLPIKIPSSSKQQRFIKLVDRIATLVEDNEYLHDSLSRAKVGEYQRKIDQLVYELYDVTPEEIAIVEGNNKEG